MNPRLNEFDHRRLVLWAADCAERVLAHFEAHRLDDDRPRLAIEAVRLWAAGKLAFGPVRKAALAAHAAARDSEDAAAVAAARSCGHAAATAHAPAHAKAAGTYAVAAIKAGTPASEAADALEHEREWQHQHMPAHLRPLGFAPGGRD